MKRARWSAAAVIAVAATALISACDSSASSGDAAKRVAENTPLANKDTWPKDTPQRGLAKGMSLPLEGYMQSYADSVKREKAQRTLQQRCMADYGFAVELPLAGTMPPPSDNDANMERRYGITDRTMAEQYGYGLPEKPTDRTRQKTPDLTEAQVEVLTGHGKPIQESPDAMPTFKPTPETYKGKKIHKGGCVGYANTRLAVSEPDFTLVSELNSKSLRQSMKTKAVKGALGDWSQCMKTKGYIVATPFDTSGRPQHVEGRPTKKEIDQALADIDCKKETKLVTLWFNTETEIQNQQIADHTDELATIKSQHEKAVAAASRALNG